MLLSACIAFARNFMLKGNWTASLSSWFLLWLLLYPVAFDGNLFLASTQCNGYDFYLGLVWFSAAFESARKNSHRALPCFSSCTSSKAQCNKRPHDFLLIKNVKLPSSNLIPKLNVSKSITRQCFFTISMYSSKMTLQQQCKNCRLLLLIVAIYLHPK